MTKKTYPLYVQKLFYTTFSERKMSAVSYVKELDGKCKQKILENDHENYRGIIIMTYWITSPEGLEVKYLLRALSEPYFFPSDLLIFQITEDISSVKSKKEEEEKKEME